LLSTKPPTISMAQYVSAGLQDTFIHDVTSLKHPIGRQLKKIPSLANRVPHPRHQ
jgi:hypothetical protein